MSMFPLDAVPIPAANPEWKFSPGILTDDVISELRKKVYKQKSREYSLFGTIINGFGYIASQFQVQMPLVGEQFVSAAKQMHQDVNRLFSNEFSSYDYFTGNGPLGTYIKDYVEMHKLCTKIHRVENEFIQHSEPRVDLEHEYYQLFDYNPLRVTSSNGIYAGPYGKLRELIKSIQTFGYQTSIYNNKDSIPKECIFESRISLESGELVTSGDFKQSGFYHQTINGISSLRLLVLIANIRDTKVACVVDLANSYAQASKLFYHHRCENVWVNNSDSSGEFYLAGTYEVLKEEADLLFERMGTTLVPNIAADTRVSIDRFVSLTGLWNALKEKGNGIDKCLTDLFPLFNTNGGQFSFSLAGIRYSYTKFQPTDEENESGYTLGFEKYVAPNSWSNDRWSFSVMVKKDNVSISGVDNALSAYYLLKKLNQFLDKVLASDEVQALIADIQ